MSAGILGKGRTGQQVIGGSAAYVGVFFFLFLMDPTEILSRRYGFTTSARVGSEMQVKFGHQAAVLEYAFSADAPWRIVVVWIFRSEE